MPRVPAGRGFTLLEALVVLVITGLVSVVLVQGFGLLLAARMRVSENVVAVDEAVIEHNLFLEPIRGIVPDYPDRPHVFEGISQRMRGLTVRPLQSRAGTPVPFTLTIEYDPSSGVTSLTYQEGQSDPLVVGSWPGETGAFSYRNLTGEWYAAWPPPNDPTAPQTPWLVRIERGAGFPENMVASIGGTHRRPLRFRDTPYGTDSFSK